MNAPPHPPPPPPPPLSLSPSLQVYRVTTESGTASGTIAAASTAVFASANEFKTVPRSSFTIRNTDDSENLVLVNTAVKGAEELTLSHGGEYVVNINANDGLKLKDDKIEVRPVDTFELLAKNGGDFALRLDNRGGAGNEALTLKAGDVHVVPYKQLHLRNKDNTKPLVALDTNAEALDVSVKDLRVFSGGGQSFVTKLQVATGVATVEHDQTGGGVEAATQLELGDRIWLSGMHACCNGVQTVLARVSSTKFTFAVASNDTFTQVYADGKALVNAAPSLWVSPVKGVEVHDDKIVVEPTSYFLVTDPGTGGAGAGVGDNLRINVASGTAAGTIASATSSIFASANQFKTVALDSTALRNRRDTRTLVATSTATENKERVRVTVDTVQIAPATTFTVTDNSAMGVVEGGAGVSATSALRVQTAALPLHVAIARIAVDAGGVTKTATCVHASTGGVRLQAGDVVTVQGMKASSLNAAWTVTGTPTATEFTFTTTESSRVSVVSGTYLPGANGAGATAQMKPLVVSAVAVTGESRTATVTHSEAYVPVRTPMRADVSDVAVSGGTATVTLAEATPAGATSTKLLQVGDVVVLTGFVDQETSIVSISVSNNVATVQHSGFGAGAVALQVGDFVTVSGNDGSSTDGTYEVTGVPDNATLTFARDGVDKTYSGGTLSRVTTSVLNGEWTVASVPSPTTFTFSATRALTAASGGVSNQNIADGAYTTSESDVATSAHLSLPYARFALTVSKIEVSGNQGGVGSLGAEQSHTPSGDDGSWLGYTSVLATVTHTAHTRPIGLVAGQTVRIAGLANAAHLWANRRWTVVGTPTSTTFQFNPREHARAPPDDGTYTETGTATALQVSARPRVQAGAVLTLSALESPDADGVFNGKAWTVVGAPTATTFQIVTTEDNRVKPTAKTYLAADVGAGARAQGAVTWAAAHAGLHDGGGVGGGSGGEGLEAGVWGRGGPRPTDVATTSAVFTSGERIDLLPRHSFSVKNNEGTGSVVSVDTTHLGLESVRIGGYYNVMGRSEPGKASSHGGESIEGGVVNTIQGSLLRVLQSDGAFRKEVLTVERERGTVLTDDRTTITPLKSHRVTSDGGIRDMFHLSTSSWESISIKKVNGVAVQGGCADSRFTSEETCTTQGAFTAGFCSDNSYSSLDACEMANPSWDSDASECSPTNLGGREVSQSKCLAPTATWTAATCRLNGVISTGYGRAGALGQSSCEASASTWSGGDAQFHAGEPWTAVSSVGGAIIKRGFVYEDVGTTGGAFKYISTQGGRLTSSDTVTTEDGDFVELQSSASQSGLLKGEISTPDGFSFDAKAKDRDTTVTLQNTFADSGLPDAVRQDRVARLNMRSTDATGARMEAVFGHEVGSHKGHQGAYHITSRYNLANLNYQTPDSVRLRIGSQGGTGGSSGAEGAGDIYHAPVSKRMYYRANSMHFNNNGAVTFDQSGTCSDSCGFHINPANKKITTTATVLDVTDEEGLIIQTGGSTKNIDLRGNVQISGTLTVAGGAPTCSQSCVAIGIGATLTSDYNPGNNNMGSTGLTISNDAGQGDIRIKPKSNRLQFDGTDLYADFSTCGGACEFRIHNNVGAKMVLQPGNGELHLESKHTTDLKIDMSYKRNYMLLKDGEVDGLDIKSKNGHSFLRFDTGTTEKIVVGMHTDVDTMEFFTGVLDFGKATEHSTTNTRTSTYHNTLLKLRNNHADSFDILVGDAPSSGSYLKFATENSKEKVIIGGGSDVGITEIKTAVVDVSSQATTLKVKSGETNGLVVGADAGNSYLRLDTTVGDGKIYIGQKSDVNKLIIQTSNIDLRNQATSVQLKASTAGALQILDHDSNTPLLIVDTSHSGNRLDIDVAEIDVETQDVLLQTKSASAASLTVGRSGSGNNNFVLDTTGTGRLALHLAELDVSNRATTLKVKNGEAASLIVSDGSANLLTLDTQTTGSKLVSQIKILDTSAQETEVVVHAEMDEALKITSSTDGDLLVLDTRNSAKKLTVNFPVLNFENQATKFAVRNGEATSLVVSDGTDDLLTLDTVGDLSETKLVSKIATLDTSNQQTDLIVKSGASSALSISETGANILLALDTSTSGERLEVNMKYLDVKNQATEITVKEDSAALTVKTTGASDSILTIDSAATGNKLTLRTANIDIANQATTLNILNGNNAALVVSDGTDNLVTISTSGNLAATKLVSKVATLDTAAQATKLHVKSADAAAFSITDDDNPGGLFVVDTATSGELIDMNVDTIEVGDDDAFTLKRPAHSTGAASSISIVGQNAGGATAVNGGDVVMQPGQKVGDGSNRNGQVKFQDAGGTATVTIGDSEVTSNDGFTAGTVLVNGGLGVNGAATLKSLKVLGSTGVADLNTDAITLGADASTITHTGATSFTISSSGTDGSVSIESMNVKTGVVTGLTALTTTALTVEAVTLGADVSTIEHTGATSFTISSSGTDGSVSIESMNVDAGVVTGLTSLTTDAVTLEADASSITHTGATSFTISSSGTDGSVNIESMNVDAGVVTGLTSLTTNAVMLGADASTITHTGATSFTISSSGTDGSVSIESMNVKTGVVTGLTALTANALTADDITMGADVSTIEHTGATSFTISSSGTDGSVNIESVNVDAGVMTGVTALTTDAVTLGADASTITHTGATSFTISSSGTDGSVSIESMNVKTGVVTGLTALTTTALTAEAVTMEADVSTIEHTGATSFTISSSGTDGSVSIESMNVKTGVVTGLTALTTTALTAEAITMGADVSTIEHTGATSFTISSSGTDGSVNIESVNVDAGVVTGVTALTTDAVTLGADASTITHTGATSFTISSSGTDGSVSIESMNVKTGVVTGLTALTTTALTAGAITMGADVSTIEHTGATSFTISSSGTDGSVSIESMNVKTGVVTGLTALTTTALTAEAITMGADVSTIEHTGATSFTISSSGTDGSVNIESVNVDAGVVTGVTALTTDAVTLGADASTITHTGATSFTISSSGTDGSVSIESMNVKTGVVTGLTALTTTALTAEAVTMEADVSTIEHTGATSFTITSSGTDGSVSIESMNVKTGVVTGLTALTTTALTAEAVTMGADVSTIEHTGATSFTISSSGTDGSVNIESVNVDAGVVTGLTALTTDAVTLGADASTITHTGATSFTISSSGTDGSVSIESMNVKTGVVTGLTALTTTALTAEGVTLEADVSTIEHTGATSFTISSSGTDGSVNIESMNIKSGVVTGLTSLTTDAVTLGAAASTITHTGATSFTISSSGTDGSVNIESMNVKTGVVTGLTALTTTALTADDITLEADVSTIEHTGATSFTISSSGTDGSVNIESMNVDAGVVTGLTALTTTALTTDDVTMAADASTIEHTGATSFTISSSGTDGSVNIESMNVDAGVVTGVTALTTDAVTLGADASTITHTGATSFTISSSGTDGSVSIESMNVKTGVVTGLTALTTTALTTDDITMAADASTIEHTGATSFTISSSGTDGSVSIESMNVKTGVVTGLTALTTTALTVEAVTLGADVSTIEHTGATSFTISSSGTDGSVSIESVNVDAGVVTGLTSLTTDAVTLDADVSTITHTGATSFTISSTGTDGSVNIESMNVKTGVVTGLTALTSTALTAETVTMGADVSTIEHTGATSFTISSTGTDGSVNIESMNVKTGVVTGLTALTSTALTAETVTMGADVSTIEHTGATSFTISSTGTDGSVSIESVNVDAGVVTGVTALTTNAVTLGAAISTIEHTGATSFTISSSGTDGSVSIESMNVKTGVVTGLTALTTTALTADDLTLEADVSTIEHTGATSFTISSSGTDGSVNIESMNVDAGVVTGLTSLTTDAVTLGADASTITHTGATSFTISSSGTDGSVSIESMNVDAGVVTGLTSLTTDAVTLDADASTITHTGATSFTISSTGTDGSVNIESMNVKTGVVTGLTALTSTALTAETVTMGADVSTIEHTGATSFTISSSGTDGSVSIESVNVDAGVVTGVTALTTNAVTLGAAISTIEHTGATSFTISSSGTDGSVSIESMNVKTGVVTGLTALTTTALTADDLTLEADVSTIEHTGATSFTISSSGTDGSVNIESMNVDAGVVTGLTSLTTDAVTLGAATSTITHTGATSFTISSTGTDGSVNIESMNVKTGVVTGLTALTTTALTTDDITMAADASTIEHTGATSFTISSSGTDGSVNIESMNVKSGVVTGVTALTTTALTVEAVTLGADVSTIEHTGATSFTISSSGTDGSVSIESVNVDAGVVTGLTSLTTDAVTLDADVSTITHTGATSFTISSTGTDGSVNIESMNVKTGVVTGLTALTSTALTAETVTMGADVSTIEHTGATSFTISSSGTDGSVSIESVNVDAGVVTGVTALTTNAVTLGAAISTIEHTGATSFTISSSGTDGSVSIESMNVKTGVVTGLTALTTTALTGDDITLEADVSTIEHTGATSFTISSSGTDGSVSIESMNVDAGVVTGLTSLTTDAVTLGADASTITHTGATSFTISSSGTDGSVSIESMNVDAGVVTGLTSLTTDAVTLDADASTIDAHGRDVLHDIVDRARTAA